jgi:deazaflavin-dependent oxidoreductase (nitroreductase family)
MTNAGRLSKLMRPLPQVTAAWSRLHAKLLVKSGGRFMPRWFGVPVLVLETVGRKSGKPRATPVIYVEIDGNPVVIAAAGAVDHMPAWWLNLDAAGEGTAVIRGERRPIRPRRAEGAERDRLWREFAKAYPTLDEYTAMTDRQFPVVVLCPR